MSDFSFLSDLLDDLSAEQLTSLLNHLAKNRPQRIRANIKKWRRDTIDLGRE